MKKKPLLEDILGLSAYEPGRTWFQGNSYYLAFLGLGTLTKNTQAI